MNYYQLKLFDSLLTNNKYIKIRYFFFIFTVLLLFADMITTYFALNYYGAYEKILWTQWIINQYGWSGVLLRFIISVILFAYLYKYQPNVIFKYSSPFIFIILLIYMYQSFINNVIIMVELKYG